MRRKIHGNAVISRLKRIKTLNYVSPMVKMHETNETFIEQWVYMVFTDAAILSFNDMLDWK